MPTENEVASAVLALINAALPSSGANIVRAYDPSTLPETRPEEFVLVTIARRSGGSPRAGRYGTTGWGIYVLAASQTSVTNARNALRLAGAAIESKALSIAGSTSTPVRFDNQRTVGPDGNWFSGVNSYTLAL